MGCELEYFFTCVNALLVLSMRMPTFVLFEFVLFPILVFLYFYSILNFRHFHFDYKIVVDIQF